MSWQTCPDCGQGYDDRQSVPHSAECDGTREGILAARDEAMEALAALVAALPSCEYVVNLERFEDGAPPEQCGAPATFLDSDVPAYYCDEHAAEQHASDELGHAVALRVALRGRA